MNYLSPRTFSTKDVRLFKALAQRAGQAIQNARLFEQERQIATFEERQRLARELHDSVTQALYSLTLLSEAGRHQALIHESIQARSGDNGNAKINRDAGQVGSGPCGTLSAKHRMAWRYGHKILHRRAGGNVKVWAGDRHLWCTM